MAARAQGVHEALQPLFQAAAALGPRPQYLASQREAENKRWLQQILHHLQREWTGSATVEPLEVGTCLDGARCTDPRGIRANIRRRDLSSSVWLPADVFITHKTASWYLTLPHVQIHWCWWSVHL